MISNFGISFQERNLLRFFLPLLYFFMNVENYLKGKVLT